MYDLKQVIRFTEYRKQWDVQNVHTVETDDGMRNKGIKKICGIYGL